jgi:hypothetical protein
MAGWRDIPMLVRHSTLAIYSKSTGGGAEGFIKALRISRDTLAKQGYIYSSSGLPVLQDIRLTSKGWLRNKKHEVEGRAGGAKDIAFAQLWKMIEHRIPVLDGPSGEKVESPANLPDTQNVESSSSKPGEKNKFENGRSFNYPFPKKK